MRAKRSIPADMSTSPLPMTVRTPKRPTSLPAREATNMMTSVMGKKAMPVESGDSPSTCWRYRELTYHMGKSDALNKRTMALASFIGPVSSRKGTSGAAARRVSTTAKRASRKRPSPMGTRALGDDQPSTPVSTIP
jgi:hypothetical protein